MAGEGGLEKHLADLFWPETPEIFLPYLSFTYEGKTTLFNVMEGYAFVVSGLDDSTYTGAMQNSPYLRSILHTPKSKGFSVLMTVPNSSVQDLRDRLSEMVAPEIQEGMKVKIARGICLGLIGVVVGLDNDEAHVLIELRTLHTIRTIPRFALVPAGDQA